MPNNSKGNHSNLWRDLMGNHKEPKQKLPENFNPPSQYPKDIKEPEASIGDQLINPHPQEIKEPEQKIPENFNPPSQYPKEIKEPEASIPEKREWDKMTPEDWEKRRFKEPTESFPEKKETTIRGIAPIKTEGSTMPEMPAQIYTPGYGFHSPAVAVGMLGQTPDYVEYPYVPPKGSWDYNLLANQLIEKWAKEPAAITGSRILYNQIPPKDSQAYNDLVDELLGKYEERMQKPEFPTTILSEEYRGRHHPFNVGRMSRQEINDVVWGRSYPQSFAKGGVVKGKDKYNNNEEVIIKAHEGEVVIPKKTAKVLRNLLKEENPVVKKSIVVRKKRKPFKIVRENGGVGKVRRYFKGKRID
jgi:hypothetical protein